MSWLSKYAFSPIKAALARAAGSSNKGVADAAQSVQGTIAKMGADIRHTLESGLTANSTAALKNTLVKDLEDGVRGAVDAYLVGAVPLGLGYAAVPVVNSGLDLLEQHLHNYVASLFDHAKEAHATQAKGQPELPLKK